MTRFYCFFLLFIISIFFNGCFLASLFNSGPKIDLAESNWEIASFSLDSVTYKPKGYEQMPSIRFDTQELRLNGNTGCNMFFATYAWLDGEKIEVRNSGMTRKMCRSQSNMKFEQKLMEEFEGDFEVLKEDGRLVLKRENLQIILTPTKPSDEPEKVSAYQENEHSEPLDKTQEASKSVFQASPIPHLALNQSLSSHLGSLPLSSSFIQEHHLSFLVSSPLAKSFQGVDSLI